MSDTIFMATVALKAALDKKRINYLNTLTLHLYTNNYTPVLTSTVPDFAEASNITMPGYASQALNDFGAVFGLNANNNAETDSGVHTFTCTGVPPGGSIDIYGWFTTDAGGVLGPAARFSVPVPITLTGPGMSVSVQVLFEDGAIH